MAKNHGCLQVLSSVSTTKVIWHVLVLHISSAFNEKQSSKMGRL